MRHPLILTKHDTGCWLLVVSREYNARKTMPLEGPTLEATYIVGSISQHYCVESVCTRTEQTLLKVTLVMRGMLSWKLEPFEAGQYQKLVPWMGQS